MMKSVFKATGTPGTTPATADTFNKAGHLFFETNPRARKCSIFKGETDGTIFTITVNLREPLSQAVWTNVTKKDLT